MFKTLWRLFILVLAIYFLKSVFMTQPQVYITWPEKQTWLQEIKYQVESLQRDAQDLPASLETKLKYLWKEIKPANNAGMV